MSEPTRNWKDVLGKEPVNETRARLYERVLEAEELIAQARYESGISHETVLAALDTVDEKLSDDQRREDRYLSTLEHFVEALGGRLEVRAIFGDEAIVVRR
ncbi:MAG: hypothetical protein ABI323_07555 [Solirubrobacteraceae bacterium]